jgi:hypothetical protein
MRLQRLIPVASGAFVWYDHAVHAVSRKVIGLLLSSTGGRRPVAEEPAKAS